jgi:hypothetical protein
MIITKIRLIKRSSLCLMNLMKIKKREDYLRTLFKMQITLSGLLVLREKVFFGMII